MSQTFPVPGVPDAIGMFVDTVPNNLEDAVALLPFWQARPGEMLLHVPYVAGFHVREGNTIRVAQIASASRESVDTYLHGSVRAALIQQRGEIALHAACLRPPDHQFAVAICGVSGAGKSSLAMELCNRGWKLLADDLLRVECTKDQPLAWPSDRHVRLWKDACEVLQVNCNGLDRVRRHAERFMVPVTSQELPLPLRLVLDLRYSDSGLSKISKTIETINALQRHAFRRRQIGALGMQAHFASAVIKLASAVSAGVLHGSRTESISSLADKVEEAITWIPR